MNNFTLFSQLPQEVRHQIWRLAASVPRVVEIHEEQSSTYGSGKAPTGEHTTRIKSNTRRPAILSICRESRQLGLKEIYTTPFLDRSNYPYGSHDAPIYINESRDIIYRGRKSCRQGEAFYQRCRNFETESEPLAVTCTLAVDIMAVTRDRQIDEDAVRRGAFLTQLYAPGSEQVLPPKNQRKPRPLGLAPTGIFPMVQECAEEIMVAAQDGLSEVILVVGNDDNLPEATFVPVEFSLDHEGERFKQARLATTCLRETLSILSPSPPTIKLMTVQRVPLKSFVRFPKLPLELQRHILGYALQSPRVIEIEHVGGLEGSQCSVIRRRVPALLHVCRNSRVFALTHLAKIQDGTGLGYFNPELDTFLIPQFGANYSRTFPSWARGVKSIAIRSNHRITDAFSGHDAKGFRDNVREIVVIYDKGRADCELQLGEVHRSEDSWNSRIYEAEHHAEALKLDIVKLERKWRKYVNQRVARGLSSTHWTVPSVRIARLQAVSHTLSPYKY